MLTPTVANVLAVYRGAFENHVVEGLSWYADRHTEALALDPENVYRAAAVIAALSPRTPWARNVALAARVYVEGKASGTLGASCAKADRCFSGESPAEVFKTSTKVRNFWLNIADPTGDGVTIDRHAFDIAVGMVTDDKARAQLNRKGEYERFADVYREAARIVGISPAQLQAITWVAWREAIGIVED